MELPDVVGQAPQLPLGPDLRFLLALSGTPEPVRKAANSLTKAIEKEVQKLAESAASGGAEPQDWERFDRRVERLEELMAQDIAGGR